MGPGDGNIIAMLQVCSGPNVNFSDHAKTGGHCGSHGKFGIGIDHLNSKSPRNFVAVRQDLQENSEAQDLHAFLWALLREVFVHRYLSSQGTGCDGIKARGAAHWLCSRAGRGLGIQTGAGEANWLCS